MNIEEVVAMSGKGWPQARGSGRCQCLNKVVKLLFESRSQVSVWNYLMAP